MSTEQEQLIGARNYDLTILGEIYDVYSPGIYRHALRLLGDEVLAEDCVSESFSRFLQSLQTGKGPRDYLKAYLYRIAHNWITDQYRRPHLEKILLDDSTPDDDEKLPESLSDSAVEKKRIRSALGGLTPDQRAVITLRYLEGWNNEEIAAVVQKPVGAVKALQHRALTSLRRYFVHNPQE